MLSDEEDNGDNGNKEEDLNFRIYFGSEDEQDSTLGDDENSLFSEDEEDFSDINCDWIQGSSDESYSHNMRFLSNSSNRNLTNPLGNNNNNNSLEEEHRIYLGIGSGTSTYFSPTSYQRFYGGKDFSQGQQ